MLRTKLKEAGVKSWRRAAAALAEHLLNTGAGEFHWEDPFDGDRTHDVEVTFDAGDARKLEKIADAMAGDELVAMAEKLIHDAADAMRSRFESEWYPYRRQQERSLQTFKNNLEHRWGAALDGLRILLDLCIDEGEKFSRRVAKSRRKTEPFARIAIMNLQARACQVTAEILCLLENGYPNGAIARWRTLYEIDVVATLISEGGDSLGERYLEHEHVDTKRSADLYERTFVAEGMDALPKRELRAVEAEYRRVLKKYGKEFGSNYGWAAGYVGNPSPRFVHLENAATGVRLRNRYKFASHNVHASPSSFIHNLADLSGQGVATVGASNAGLAVPGHLAAVTLLRVTYLLVKDLRSFDAIALLNALISIRDDAANAFADADALLRKEDAAIRAAVAEHDINIDTTFI
jgi:hypothetical protein